MKSISIARSRLSGEIVVPPSKSHSMRSVLFASMCSGVSRIKNLLFSTDVSAMIKACENFGACISSVGEGVSVKGVGGKPAFEKLSVDAGDSGQVLRFMSSICALVDVPIKIYGSEELEKQRSMGQLLCGLRQLGVYAISVNDDYMSPVIIRGPMVGGRVLVKISGEDSQHVSAIIIAAAFRKYSVEIVVDNPGETPWVDLTLSWLSFLGVDYEKFSSERYIVNGSLSYSCFNYEVPGDWSSAAFLMVAALVTGSRITISDLDTNDPQGDKRIVDILESCGAKIFVDCDKKAVVLDISSSFRSFDVDVNDCIDAVAIIAVFACFCDGRSVIRGATIARNKESNRLRSISLELKKMGAKIDETEDGLVVEGSRLHGACVTSFKDHRIAMALAVAAMGAHGTSTICDIGCVSKSYPGFFDDLAKIGANLF